MLVENSYFPVILGRCVPSLFAISPASLELAADEPYLHISPARSSSTSSPSPRRARPRHAHPQLIHGATRRAHRPARPDERRLHGHERGHPDRPRRRQGQERRRRAHQLSGSRALPPHVPLARRRRSLCVLPSTPFLTLISVARSRSVPVPLQSKRHSIHLRTDRLESESESSRRTTSPALFFSQVGSLVRTCSCRGGAC